MKPRTLLILLTFAVAAVLACVAISRKSAFEVKASLPQKPFEAAPVNDSLKIVVRDAKGEAVVEKIDGLWVVPSKGGYPADFSKVAGLLRELVELKPAQSIPGGEAVLERFELQPKGGLEIQVFAKDAKPMLELRRGKLYKQAEISDEDRQMAMMMGRDPENSGARFAFLPTVNAVVVIDSPLQLAAPKDSAWLDKDFPKISELKSATLLDNGKPQWTLKREKAGADLSIDGQVPAKTEFDKQGAASATSSLSWLNFADVAGKASKIEHPRTLSLETFDGFTFTFIFGDESNGKIPATVAVAFKPEPRVAAKDEKPEDAKKAEEAYNKKLSDDKAKATKWAKAVANWLYLFDRQSFEKLLVDREKFFKAKAEEVKPEAAAKKTEPKDKFEIPELVE